MAHIERCQRHCSTGPPTPPALRCRRPGKAARADRGAAARHRFGRAASAFLAKEIAAIDEAITDAIEADGILARRAALPRSIPGVEVVTAATLIAELPELGTTGNKQLAALTGIAPMNRDSGMSRGQEHIAGGRMTPRCCLYMATVVAIRCNPVIRPFYKHLREQGKSPEVAIVAAMRKLITTANSMLAHDRSRHADPA